MADQIVMNETAQDGLTQFALVVDLRQYLLQPGAMHVEKGTDHLDCRGAHDRITVFLNGRDQRFNTLHADMELGLVHFQSSFLG